MRTLLFCRLLVKRLRSLVNATDAVLDTQENTTFLFTLKLTGENNCRLVINVARFAAATRLCFCLSECTQIEHKSSRVSIHLLIM